MDSGAEFGRFFKRMRERAGLSLRRFCLEHALDPGNLSKLERGLIPPPASREKLEKYASYLGLEPGSDDWYEFFDLAAAARGRIHFDVLSDRELVAKLPVVFRTLRGQKVPPEKLKELAEVIRKA